MLAAAMNPCGALPIGYQFRGSGEIGEIDGYLVVADFDRIRNRLNDFSFIGRFQVVPS